VYRDFTRVGAGKTPDAKTMGRWGVAVGPRWSSRFTKAGELAQANGLARGAECAWDPPW